VSEEHNIPKEELEELVDCFFAQMKEYITDPRMPKIRITNFGTFRPQIGKIELIIKRWIRYSKFSGKKEGLAQKLRPLWKVRRRLVEEKHGVATWKKWKKLKLDE